MFRSPGRDLNPIKGKRAELKKANYLLNLGQFALSRSIQSPLKSLKSTTELFKTETESGLYPCLSIVKGAIPGIPFNYGLVPTSLNGLEGANGG